MDTFLETVRRYTDATTIIKHIVAWLVQYIAIDPAIKAGGITDQRVTIPYNCMQSFEGPGLYLCSGES